MQKPPSKNPLLLASEKKPRYNQVNGHYIFRYTPDHVKPDEIALQFCRVTIHLLPREDGPRASGKKVGKCSIWKQRVVDMQISAWTRKSAETGSL